MNIRRFQCGCTVRTIGYCPDRKSFCCGREGNDGVSSRFASGWTFSFGTPFRVVCFTPEPIMSGDANVPEVLRKGPQKMFKVLARVTRTGGGAPRHENYLRFCNREQYVTLCEEECNIQ